MKNKVLFCFTYAGGTYSFYDLLDGILSPNIEVVKLEYSGHGIRHKEPLFEDFCDTVEDLYKYIFEKYKTILEQDNVEYALFGYSMGSIVAVEMLKTILERGDFKNPKQIFLAAHEPHTKSEMLNISIDCIDQYVKQRTIDFGGVPEKLLNNNSFWRMYLPIYRSDYLMISKYKFEELNLKTEIPAVVFYSETDTKLEDMKKWKKYFVDSCDFIEFKGNHFFIKEHCMDIANVINKRLECQ